MRAMLLRQPKPIDERPLELVELQRPHPGPGEILIAVSACGVCHTDLHVCEGELPPHKSPVVPGHQIVGRVAELGEGVTEHSLGDRVGRALAALDRRHLPLLPARRREPLRQRPLHGLGRRRRLRRVRGGAGGLQLPAPRGAERPRRGAAAVRRHHRLPFAVAVGARALGTRQGGGRRPRRSRRRRRPPPRPLRLRRRRPHLPADRALLGRRGVRLHSRREAPPAGPRARRRVGRRGRRGARRRPRRPSSTRPSSSRRPASS